jgi:flagellar hook-length control protein FliK
MMGATAPTTNVAAHANVAAAFGPAGNALDVNTLTSAISRPLAEGNGTYTVVVAMHPAELGHVQAIMSLNGSNLQVSLTPQSDHAHAALSAAVNDMRNELARGGVNVSIDLHHPQSHTPGDTERGPHHDTTNAAPTRVTSTAAAVAESSSARDVGQINLML